MYSFREKQMNLDELPQLGWGDGPYSFRERDNMYSTPKMNVPAVVEPQTDIGVAPPALTTFGECMDPPDIISRK